MCDIYEVAWLSHLSTQTVVVLVFGAHLTEYVKFLYEPHAAILTKIKFSLNGYMVNYSQIYVISATEFAVLYSLSLLFAKFIGDWFPLGSYPQPDLINIAAPSVG